MRGQNTSAAAPLIQMIDALRHTTNRHLNITYSGTVTAASFDPTAFNLAPQPEIGSTVIQLAANEIRIFFVTTINANGLCNYNGSTPGILTPQTIAYHS